MDFPLGDDDLSRTQRFRPGGHMLVITVDQSAIQIEQQRRPFRTGIVASRRLAGVTLSHELDFLSIGPRFGAKPTPKVAQMSGGKVSSRLTPTTLGEKSSEMYSSWRTDDANSAERPRTQEPCAGPEPAWNFPW